MKNSLIKLIRWFCSKVSFNELASAVIIFTEILNNSRKDILLKPKKKPPNYRNFKVDSLLPLDKSDKKIEPTKLNWRQIKNKVECAKNKRIAPVNRKNNNVPIGTICQACRAPDRYLYINNGKKKSQVKCKICNKTSSTNRVRRESKAKYFCPYCSNAIYKWKESKISTIYKCFNYKCSNYLKNKLKLTDVEKKVRNEQKYTPHFKLHYQYREFHIKKQDINLKRPDNSANVKLSNIRNNYQTLGLILTFAINLGLSARLTKHALKDIFGITVSHQTILNYISNVSAVLSPFIDKNCPIPNGISAADETYIIVNGEWRYTWFIIDAQSRAICGYNLSTNRDTSPALALLYNCFGDPNNNKSKKQIVTDGNPSYDMAVMAYNSKIKHNKNRLKKTTVIGLKNLDNESKEYRKFKQLVERLNRTYKYHTRPRAGFKSFDGAVSLTTLFVAFYNFMRPHSYIEGKQPINLECLKKTSLMPDKWLALIKAAAA